MASTIDKSLYEVPHVIKKYNINIKKDRVLITEVKKYGIKYLFDKEYAKNNSKIEFCKDFFFNAIKIRDNNDDNTLRFIMYNWSDHRLVLLSKTERKAELVYPDINNIPDNNEFYKFVVANQEIKINLKKKKFKKFGNNLNLFILFPLLKEDDHRICVPEVIITDSSIHNITEDNFEEVVINKKNKLVAFNSIDSSVDSYLISANLK